MNGCITEERIECDSPSMAAAIVCGHKKMDGMLGRIPKVKKLMFIDNN